MFGLSTKRRTEPVHQDSLMERPLAGLAELGSEFDSLFQRFWAEVPRLGSAWDELARFQAYDWEDEGDHYMLRAEAPGFEPEEFDVQMRGSQLVLSAEHKEEKRAEGKQARGLIRGQFYQSITLPPGVLADQIEAKYRSGILEIRLPKSPEARAQRIAVKAD